MKPNVIVALLVGLVLGFAFGKALSGTSGGPASLTGRLLQPSGPAMTDETSLAVKSSEMPAGTFTGMTDAQKVAVMRVMNEHDCDCGCGLGSLAVCIKKDPNCPNSPGKLKQLVAMAKQGKSYEQMNAELFGPGAKPKPTRPGDDMATVFKVPLEDSPALGRPSAPVTLVEISDYQCPFCGRANTTIQQLQKDYGDKLRLVMKENPLDSIHPFARGAAKAALAAGVQCKYWPMHDKLFENQRSLDQASLEKYAAEVGLNVDRFKKDQNDPKWDQVIARDQALAQQLQATSTPQFFVNGRHISGARELNVFKGIIDEEITKADTMVKSGVKPEQVYAKLMEQAASGPSAAPAPAAAPAAAAVKKVPVPDDAPFFGPKNAKVTIVEFSDFECPFCQRAIAPLHQVKDAYPKDVKVVFRQFPLPATMHPHAMQSAEASLAAHEQGKFWQMHDKLFDNRTALNRPDLEKYAEEIGLNMSKFKAALDSGKFKAKIAEDQSAGGSVGVGGTPTFFIDGQVQVGALSFEQWKAKIDEEIKKADKLLASGVKPEKLYEKMLDQGSAPAPAVAANAPPPAPGVAPPPGPVKDVTVGGAPVKGPKGAPVTIVEYSDFQCPFCSRAVEVIKQLEGSYKDKFRIAYKHQPLQQLHPNAQLAAEAAVAAQEQGKFWEYHDKLFANQRALDRDSLEKYAQEVGLDMNRFKAALDSHKFKDAVANDSAEGFKVGADATPTFFVNGRMVQGADYNQIKAIMDDELAKKHK